MTTEQRLDQLEDEFETVKQILASAARYAESATRNLDRFIEESRDYQARTDARMAQTDEHMAQIDARMEQNELRMIVLENRFAQFIDRMDQIEAQAAIDRANFQDRMQVLAEQAERDRNQANLDRAEFRSTVEGILNALTQRFNGNGNT